MIPRMASLVMSGDQAVAVLLQNVSGAESSPLDCDEIVPGNGLREEEYRIQEFSLDPSR